MSAEQSAPVTPPQHLEAQQETSTAPEAPQLSPLAQAALQAEVAQLNDAVTRAQLAYLTRRLQELVIENSNLREAAAATAADAATA